MNSTILKNLLGLILVVGAIVFTVILLFSVKTNEEKQIKKDEVYVVGQSSSIGQRRTRRVEYIFKYRYKELEHECTISRVGRSFKKGDLIFLKISASKPEHSKYIYYSQPCSCYSFETAPAEGWKEIPVCREMRVNKYSFLLSFMNRK